MDIIYVFLTKDAKNKFKERKNIPNENVLNYLKTFLYYK